MNRWPHLKRYLRMDATGGIEDDYLRWHFATETVDLPCADMAAAYDEWADFFEWRLTQRTDELATDRAKRHLVTEWTDNMAYCCRRNAAYARGEDPGDWIPQHQRRPDIDAEGRMIVAEIIARLNERRRALRDGADDLLRMAG